MSRALNQVYTAYVHHYAYNTNLYVLAILRLCIVELHSGTALRTQSLLLLAIRDFGVVRETGCRQSAITALWDCFGGRICRHVENAFPKTVPQCTLTTSRPGLLRNFKMANYQIVRENLHSKFVIGVL